MTTSPHKVALVTGAARGIGHAVAKRFLGEGYRVALLDIEGELLEQSVKALNDPDNTLAIHADVSDADAVAKYMHANSLDTPIGKASWNKQGDLNNFEFDVFTWHKDGSKTVAK